MNKIKIILLAMLTTIAWSSIAADDFNPANPPEPNDIYVYKHNIRVTATPAGKAYTSGTGRYAEGTTVTISTSSAEAGWVFQHWLIDGEIDTQHTASSFRYTLGNQDVVFTAVYEYVEPEDPNDPNNPNDPGLPPFDPANPAEPQTPEFPDKPGDPQPPATPKYSLGLVSAPFEACSFNTGSGRTYTAGTAVNLSTTGNQGFRFLGWYDQDGTLLSESTTFTFIIPEEDSTLTALWIFDPTDDPGDPESTQENVSNPMRGDINRDGRVTSADLGVIINIITGNMPTTSYADLNADGVINSVDLGLLINIIIGQ